MPASDGNGQPPARRPNWKLLGWLLLGYIYAAAGISRPAKQAAPTRSGRSWIPLRFRRRGGAG
jgi:hypothetical protein